MRLNESQYDRTGDKTFLQHSVACALQAVFHTNSKDRHSRRLIARCLWHLETAAKTEEEDNEKGKAHTAAADGKDGGEGAAPALPGTTKPPAVTISSTFQKFAKPVPLWVWLEWVPHLLNGLCSDSRCCQMRCREVLYVASVYGQALYYPLKVFLDAQKEVATKGRHVATEEAKLNAANAAAAKADPAAAAAAVAGSESGKDLHLSSGRVTPSAGEGQTPSAPTASAAAAAATAAAAIMQTPLLGVVQMAYLPDHGHLSTYLSIMAYLPDHGHLSTYLSIMAYLPDHAGGE